MTDFTRRMTLGAMGAALAAPALLGGARPARAAADMKGPSRPTHFRFPLGAFEVTTIFDGAIQLGGPYPIFGQDQFEEDVVALAEAHNLPGDRMEIGFTPTLVNTGAELILFDAGNGALRRPDAGKLRWRMQAAGYAPEDVDIVVLTHFHGDHIGGLMENGERAFPNARYVTAAQEYDHWIAAENALALANVKPLAEETAFIADGEDVVSGVTAIAAYGHTPGHTAFHIESEGKRLALTADAANHYVASLERPDWHVRFDMDKAQAAQTRKDLFGMIAADGIPFIGYHMPSPGVGYLFDNGEGGFRYAGASYQLFL